MKPTRGERIGMIGVSYHLNLLILRKAAAGFLRRPADPAVRHDLCRALREAKLDTIDLLDRGVKRSRFSELRRIATRIERALAKCPPGAPYDASMRRHIREMKLALAKGTKSVAAWRKVG